jgi:hypothetical protein
MTKPSKDKKVKHLLSKLQMLRQIYMDNIVQVEYLSTEEMITDYLKKPIHREDYLTTVAKLLGLQISLTKYSIGYNTI